LSEKKYKLLPNLVFAASDVPTTGLNLRMMTTTTLRTGGIALGFRIPFYREQQKQTASQSRPLVGNTHDLKVSFVSYLKENKPKQVVEVSG
jgi:hypothetical protein